MKYFYSLILLASIFSCETEDENDPFTDNVYFNIWETDSIAFKEYTNGMHSKTTLVKKEFGFFQYTFNGVGHDDLNNCTESENLNKSVLRINYIDSDAQIINYDGDCFKNYVMYNNAIFIADKETLSNDNHPWGETSAEDKYEILSENAAFVIVTSTEVDFPQIGVTTETYYYFKKNQ